LAALTTMAVREIMGAACSATPLITAEGTANSTSSLPATAFRSDVISSSAGRLTPGRKARFSRSFSILSVSCCCQLHRVTLCPLLTSRQARAVPQPPAPTTVISIVSPRGNEIRFFSRG